MNIRVWESINLINDKFIQCEEINKKHQVHGAETYCKYKWQHLHHVYCYLKNCYNHRFKKVYWRHHWGEFHKPKTWNLQIVTLIYCSTQLSRWKGRLLILKASKFCVVGESIMDIPWSPQKKIITSWFIDITINGKVIYFVIITFTWIIYDL